MQSPIRRLAVRDGEALAAMHAIPTAAAAVASVCQVACALLQADGAAIRRGHVRLDVSRDADGSFSFRLRVCHTASAATAFGPLLLRTTTNTIGDDSQRLGHLIAACLSFHEAPPSSSSLSRHSSEDDTSGCMRSSLLRHALSSLRALAALSESVLFSTDCSGRNAERISVSLHKDEATTRTVSASPRYATTSSAPFLSTVAVRGLFCRIPVRCRDPAAGGGSCGNSKAAFVSAVAAAFHGALLPVLEAPVALSVGNAAPLVAECVPIGVSAAPPSTMRSAVAFASARITALFPRLRGRLVVLAPRGDGEEGVLLAARFSAAGDGAAPSAASLSTSQALSQGSPQPTAVVVVSGDARNASDRFRVLSGGEFLIPPGTFELPLVARPTATPVEDFCRGSPESAAQATSERSVFVALMAIYVAPVVVVGPSVPKPRVACQSHSVRASGSGCSLCDAASRVNAEAALNGGPDGLLLVATHRALLRATGCEDRSNKNSTMRGAPRFGFGGSRAPVVPCATPFLPSPQWFGREGRACVPRLENSTGFARGASGWPSTPSLSRLSCPPSPALPFPTHPQSEVVASPFVRATASAPSDVRRALLEAAFPNASAAAAAAAAPELPFLGVRPMRPPPQQWLGGELPVPPREALLAAASPYAALPVVQWASKFLVCVAEDKNHQRLLICCDQHAAHERVRVERFLATLHAHTTSVALCADNRNQTPATTGLSVDPVRFDAIRRHRSALARWGWVFTEAATQTENSAGRDGGDVALRVVAAPRLLLEGFPLTLDVGDDGLGGHLDALDDSGGSALTPPPAFVAFAVNRACRGAIMFGDALSPSETATLLRATAAAEQYLVCAHGRPSMTVLCELDGTNAGGLESDESEAGTSFSFPFGRSPLPHRRTLRFL